jgi:hypothetical protein
MSVEIEQFCGGHGIRAYLDRPFQWHRHTYATNGHIMVRVPLRAGFPRLPKKVRQTMQVDRPLDVAHHQARFVPFTDALRPRLPRLEPRTCLDCGGAGKVRDGRADVECDGCEGLGFTRPPASISIAGAPFDTHYLGLIASLPRVEIASAAAGTDFDKHDPGHVLAFRFDGGIGAVMGMRSTLADHRGDLLGEVAP